MSRVLRGSRLSAHSHFATPCLCYVVEYCVVCVRACVRACMSVSVSVCSVRAGLKHVGIFRLPGNVRFVHEVRAQLDEGAVPAAGVYV